MEFGADIDALEELVDLILDDAEHLALVLVEATGDAVTDLARDRHLLKNLADLVLGRVDDLVADMDGTSNDVPDQAVTELVVDERLSALYQCPLDRIGDQRVEPRPRAAGSLTFVGVRAVADLCPVDIILVRVS